MAPKPGEPPLTSQTQTANLHKPLRRILGVFWPNTISNINLWECTKQETVDIQLLRRKWSWIGHTLRRNTTAITKQALTWNPQGKRGRGRPKNTWRRSTHGEGGRKRVLSLVHVPKAIMCRGLSFRRKMIVLKLQQGCKFGQ